MLDLFIAGVAHGLVHLGSASLGVRKELCLLMEALGMKTTSRTVHAELVFLQVGQCDIEPLLRFGFFRFGSIFNGDGIVDKGMCLRCFFEVVELNRIILHESNMDSHNHFCWPARVGYKPYHGFGSDDGAIVEAYNSLISADAPALEDAVSPTDVQLLPLASGDIPRNLFPEIADILMALASVQTTKGCA